MEQITRGNIVMKLPQAAGRICGEPEVWHFPDHGLYR